MVFYVSICRCLYLYLHRYLHFFLPIPFSVDLKVCIAIGKVFKPQATFEPNQNIQYTNLISRDLKTNMMTISKETIVHLCALTYIPHVSRVHAVQYIPLEYHSQPSTLHVTIVVLKCFGGRRRALTSKKLGCSFTHLHEL